MVDSSARTDSTRFGWNLPDDGQSITLDASRWRGFQRPHVWRPPADVYEVDDEIIVRIEVAGLRENDLAITIEGQYLIIQGIRPDIPEKRAYHQMEIPFGQFSLEIDLPSPVEPGMAQANYRDGFLRIRLPKAP